MTARNAASIVKRNGARRRTFTRLRGTFKFLNSMIARSCGENQVSGQPSIGHGKIPRS
jgi:hypothetical protein